MSWTCILPSKYGGVVGTSHLFQSLCHLSPFVVCVVRKAHSHFYLCCSQVYGFIHCLNMQVMDLMRQLKTLQNTSLTETASYLAYHLLSQASTRGSVPFSHLHSQHHQFSCLISVLVLDQALLLISTAFAFSLLSPTDSILCITSHCVWLLGLSPNGSSHCALLLGPSLRIVCFQLGFHEADVATTVAIHSKLLSFIAHSLQNLFRR